MKKLFAFTLIILVSACTMTSAEKYDPSKVALIKRGQTTKSEAIALLGNEYDTQTASDGELLIYQGKTGMDTSIVWSSKFYGEYLVLVVKNNIVVDKYISDEKLQTFCLGRICADPNSQHKKTIE